MLTLAGCPFNPVLIGTSAEQPDGPEQAESHQSRWMRLQLPGGPCAGPQWHPWCKSAGRVDLLEGQRL